ncbi:MAG: hypothetical protein AB7V22_02710 [Kiritimatiellia bacterium]
MATPGSYNLHSIIVGLGLSLSVVAAVAQTNSPVVMPERAGDKPRVGEGRIPGSDSGLAATNGDVLPEEWKKRHGLDPADPSVNDLDPDGDGLTNQEEYLHGTNPKNSDTDGDGLWDGTEVAVELNPVAAQTEEGLADAELDSDGDGYSNLEEQSRGYGPADPYDTPAMPGWPQQNSWADGSTLWRDTGPGEMP